MASIQSVQTGELLKLQKAINVTDVTKFPALQIQAVGALAYYKVEVEAAGNILLTGDNTDGTTALYTIDLSTPAAGLDTYFELKNHINNATGGHFRCYLVGVRPEHKTDNTLDTLAATAIKTGAAAGVAANGLTLYLDEAQATSSAYYIGVGVTNDAFTSQPTGGLSTRLSGRSFNEFCENGVNLMNINLTSATGTALATKLYSCDDEAGTSSLLWSDAWVSATAENWPSSNVPTFPHFVKANLGHRLLIEWSMATAPVTACAISVVAYTKHLSGGEVRGANYTGCV